MTKEEPGKNRKMQEAAAAMGSVIVPLGGDQDKGDSVIQKDPNVELTKIQLQMGMAVPPYEGVLLQVTPFDHPIQTISIIKDLTMLDFYRSFGLPEDVYNSLKGFSFLDEKGIPQIRNTGFNGFMRARMGLLYPGIEGMEFHPREQIMKGTARRDQEKKERKWYQKLLGIGGEQ